LSWIWLPVALIIIILLPITHAYNGEEYSIEQLIVKLDLGSGDELFYIKLIPSVDGIRHFDFAFNSNIKAEDSSGVSLKVEDLGGKKRIYFPRPLRKGESFSFTLKTTEKVIPEKGNYFYKGFTTPYDIDTFRLLVVFPEGMFPETRTFNRSKPDCCSSDTFHRSTSIPPDGIAIRDNRVTFMWERQLKAGDSFEVGIHFPEKEGPNYFVLSALLIASATFFIGFMYAKRKRQVEVAKVFLNEEERKIVEFIRSHGGEVLQEKIWKSDILPFSRPKVSRIISDLESRGLIEREPYKKTFKVKLNI